MPAANKFDNSNTKATFETYNHSNILRRKLLKRGIKWEHWPEMV